MADVQAELADQEAHEGIGFLEAIFDTIGCGCHVSGLEQQEQDQAGVRYGHTLVHPKTPGVQVLLPDPSPCVTFQVNPP